ncbi:FecR family protein [Joostella atrarenae]|uniref:FecR family protein n=1 Tax=Joostella atrarenae TaxID=679257 RepID=A0ABS9J6E9_9FLAO|nr:FecR family protein [Joostella atrarenae]MCF8716005.1 FecR family protein [Joostella atrarenae]
MDQINDILIKKLHNRHTEEEERMFKSWILESKENSDFYKKLKRLKKENDLHRINQIDTDKAWQEILTKHREKRKLTNKIVLKRVLASAAVFIGIIALGISYYNLKQIGNTPEEPIITLQIGKGKTNNIILSEQKEILNHEGDAIAKKVGSDLVFQPINKKDYSINTVHVPNGKTLNIILSDSTSIHINAGSTLKFPTNFEKDKKRVVTLEGEGFFNVTKNKEQPFIVKTTALDITVLGTQFNVNAYANNLNSNIALIEGSVKVSSKNKNIKGIQLAPNQTATLNVGSNNIDVKNEDVSKYTAWIEGKIIIEAIPFSEIIKQLERKYNVTIINNNKALEDQNFTASFDIETIDEVMEAFKISVPFEYKIQGKEITITNPEK